MKRIFFALFMFLALGLSAQSYTIVTLDTLTNAETVNFDLGTFTGNGNLVVGVVYTDLSGTPAATTNLQTAPIGSTLWATITSDTLTDVTSQSHYFTHDAVGHKYRLSIVSSGTQSTEVEPWVIWKKD